MHIKTIRRDDWTCMIDKDVLIWDFAWKGMTGKIALIRINSVSVPFVIDYGVDRVTIADAGYSWVQIALTGKYFWITSMFDAQDRLVEIYVDMTNGNITDTDEPYFADLYLDYVVHVRRNAVMELDREELKEAFRRGDLTPEQYQRTLVEGEKVFRYLQNNRLELENLLRQEQQRLKASLPN